MAIDLRYATASQGIPLGIFVDDVDGKTAETGLSIANTDIKIWKSGASSLVNKNSGGATHMAGGTYLPVMDATDTNTIGPMVISCHMAGALPIRVECVVLPQSMYDLKYGADGARKLGLIGYGTMQAGSTSTIAKLSTGTSFANDAPNGSLLIITGGTGEPQGRTVVDWNNTTKEATVDPPFVVTPDDTSTYAWVALGPAETVALPAVNVKQIDDDATAAVNLEAACDGTGFAIGGPAAVNAILAAIVEGTTTVGDVLRGVTAALMAKLSIVDNHDGTFTFTFRDLADTKNRMVTVVDATGRISVTLSLTS